MFGILMLCFGGNKKRQVKDCFTLP